MNKLSQQYVAGLRQYLKQGSRASLQPALTLGHRAVVLKLETLELARMHERALVTLELTKGKSELINQAELFFIESITPIVETHRAARQSKIDLVRLNERLERSTMELAETNRRLHHGIVRRQKVEAALKKSREHYTKLLHESLTIQNGLRHLARQALSSQELERKKISRELQNEIAQTLLGINIRLTSLKQNARNNTKGLKNEIASTHRLVAESAKSVRLAARKFSNS